MRTPFAALPLLLLTSACPPDAPGDDGGDPPVDVVLGGVVLEQDRAPFWQASAAFAEPVANSACTVEDNVGGCTFATCDTTAAPIAPAAHLDAGAVTVESTAKSVTLVRDDGDGRYGVERVDGEEFFENGGELFAEATGGDDVEGFTLTLRAPTPLQMVTPPLASVTVKVTEALPLEWTGTSQGELRIVLSNAGGLSATCTAPSTAGAFAIPAEVIGRFPLGDGAMTVTGQVTTTGDLANARHVTFTAQTPATSAVGVNANYFVTFASP